MSLIKADSLTDVARRRDRMLQAAEDDLANATSLSIRRFLARMMGRIDEGLTAALTASPSTPFVTSSLFTLGELQGWWQNEVDTNVTAAARRVWQAGHFDTSDNPLSTSSLQHAGDYLSNVTDRLSRTASPTIAESAFDRVRVSLADEIGRGSTTRQMTERLGAELNWQGEQVPFWRDRLAETDGRIDQILDPLGPPGSPVRETMRMNDPQIRELQAQRTDMVRRLDRDRSTWENRAETIARTESTGAYNAGALDAGHEEGARVKVWVAAVDDVTRDSHLDASGDCVGIDEPFDVGGDLLDMPGDPSGSAEETVNCRCTIVFDVSCEAAGRLTARTDGLTDDEIERRQVAAEDAAGIGPVDTIPEGFDPDGFDPDNQDSFYANTEVVDGERRFTAERLEQIHDPYVERNLSGAVRVSEPEFHVMGGGPASGKSSLIDSGQVKLPRGHVMANADEAKEAIPEFKAGLRANNSQAAAFAHEESSTMAKRLVAESLDSNYNTVLDGTGNGTVASLGKKIASARAHGAKRIVGDYVTVDTDEAVRRAVLRAERSGRHVPEDMMRRTHAAVSDTFDKVRSADLFDELRLYDNNGPSPRLIYEKVLGAETILDPDAYAAFVRKAAR